MQALQGAPCIGTALPLVQHGTSSLPQEIPLPAVGSWVKLRNLAATLVDGQLQVRYPVVHTALARILKLRRHLWTYCTPLM